MKSLETDDLFSRAEASDPDLLLWMDQVEKTYPAAAAGTEAAPVLRGVDFALRAVDAVAVVGPSGSGKSTLLHLMGGLDQPSEGRIAWGARTLSTLSERQLAVMRNREIGFVFQQHYLLPQCTVLENVLVPTLPRPPAERAEAEARAVRLLARVGLEPRLRHRPAQLSGGERQRAAVIRALINQPRILLADEPTGALDRDTAARLADLLVELKIEEGFALVVATHDLSLAGRMQCAFAIQEGRLEALPPS
jgi:lipoprotein-releasing system ATP-binding protein